MSDCVSKFRAFRILMGWTQGDVAGLTGFSIPMISLVENGKREFSASAKVHVARCLGAEVGELFDPPPLPDPGEADAA